MIESHKDLSVWKRSIDLSVAIYKLTVSFPREEVYCLTNQLRRAGISIASNIAEGYGRGTRGEYKQFLAIARGSNLELQTQLEIARQLEYASNDRIANVENLSAEVGKMLTAMLKKL